MIIKYNTTEHRRYVWDGGDAESISKLYSPEFNRIRTFLGIGGVVSTWQSWSLGKFWHVLKSEIGNSTCPWNIAYPADLIPDSKSRLSLD